MYIGPATLTHCTIHNHNHTDAPSRACRKLLDLLIRALFDPKLRLNTTERRAAASRLLAVASTALLDGSVDRGDAEALRRDLVEASDLLAEEATLHWNMATSGTPAALKRLLRWPAIAMGFLHWLRATIQDPEFHNSRQFNEVMAVFMRLLQHLVVARPLHQPAVFAALRALLRLKPTESSFQIIRMKRQALQCCVFLVSHVRTHTCTHARTHTYLHMHTCIRVGRGSASRDTRATIAHPTLSPHPSINQSGLRPPRAELLPRRREGSRPRSRPPLRRCGLRAEAESCSCFDPRACHH